MEDNINLSERTTIQISKDTKYNNKCYEDDKSRRTKLKLLIEENRWTFWAVRYFGLGAICILYFVTLLEYDIPGSLQTELMKEYSFGAFTFSQIMSSSSWCSFLCFIGGYYVDKTKKLNLGLMICMVIYFIGNSFYLLGIYLNNFTTIIIGRILSGLGGETMGSLTSVYILHWFAIGRINLAFGLVYSLCQLEPAFVYQIATPLYYSLLDSLDVGERENTHAKQRMLSYTMTILVGGAYVLTMICCGIIFTIYNSKLHGKTTEKRNDVVEDYKNVFDELKKIIRFSKEYWVLVGAMSFVFTSMYNFIALSQDFFVSYKGLSVEDANYVTSSFSLTICLSTLLSGFIIDKFHYNIYFLFVSVIFCIISFLLQEFTDYIFAPVMILGTAMGTFCTAHATVISDIVEPHQLATAYSLSYSALLTAVGIGFAVVGYLTDYFGYGALDIYHIFLQIGGAICIFLLWMLMRRHKRN